MSQATQPQSDQSTRDLFCIPDGDVVYLCGNSLGLMPMRAREAVIEELDDWARLGVEGHFKSKDNWYRYHETCREMGARLVGALPHEVVFMNTLTVNLHLMMVSFFRPVGKKRKILVDWPIFPSDLYAVKSQLRLHGLEENDLLIAKPRDGEHTLRTEDVVALIEQHRDEIALVLLAGVNFATGQWMDMPGITKACRELAVTIGWDCAHAAGNVPMRLHDWGADFACWCTYKYMNSGPGAVAGCFIHERHHAKMNPDAFVQMPRCEGWWGNDPDGRFVMGSEFAPVASADAWQVSNPPILSFVPVKVSLEIFDEVGMDALRARSIELTKHLESCINGIGSDRLSIVTPREPDRRGCQLSVAIGGGDPQSVFVRVKEAGLIADFRQPNIIRLAPVPLYNTIDDCERAAGILASVVDR